MPGLAYSEDTDARKDGNTELNGAEPREHDIENRNGSSVTSAVSQSAYNPREPPSPNSSSTSSSHQLIPPDASVRAHNECS